MQRRYFFVIGIGLITAVAPLSSQTVGLTRPGRSGFALEAARPQFSDDSESLGFTTGAFFLSGHTDLRPGLKLIVELPFAHVSSDDLLDESSTAIGNPYVGMRIARNRLRVDLGGRAPLASEDEFASFVGVIAELERFEAFLPEAATLSASIRAEMGPETGLGLALFGGPALLIPTGDDEFVDNENELMLSYGLEPAYRSNALRAGVRFLGRYVSTESGSFADRSMHQIGLFADFGSGPVRPGLHLRLPLDEDIRDDLSWVFGLNVQIVLGR